MSSINVTPMADIMVTVLAGAVRMGLEQRFQGVPSGARLVIVEADEVALATHPYR
jgi:hypothetical protein